MSCGDDAPALAFGEPLSHKTYNRIKVPEGVHDAADAAVCISTAPGV